MPYGITRSYMYLPHGTGSVSRLYSIYPPVKDKRLSRPEQTRANDLPECRLYKVSTG